MADRAQRLIDRDIDGEDIGFVFPQKALWLSSIEDEQKDGRGLRRVQRVARGVLQVRQRPTVRDRRAADDLRARCDARPH